MIYEKTNWELIKLIVQKILTDNCDETTAVGKLKCLFKYIASNTDENNPKVQYLQYFLYRNYTHKDVRDRKVTARNFEDFISLILDTEPTDSKKKPNPSVSEEITILQTLLSPQRFSIINKLSTNKREKSDTFVLEEGTNINIKTLKGSTNYKKSGANTEINIGSLCYESTFYKLLTDTTFDNLSDRTKGLGSAPQLFRIILSEIFFLDKYEDFKDRLEMFLKYLYNDDYYFVAFKSDYQMHIYQFEGSELVDFFINIIKNSIDEYKKIKDSINLSKFEKSFNDFDTLEKLKKDGTPSKAKKDIGDILSIISRNTNDEYKNFVDALAAFVFIYYRWENNNLRIQIDRLIDNTVWSSKDIEDIKDIPYYMNSTIKNPFRKENLTVLDFKHLESSKLPQRIDEINAEYLNNMKEELKFT